MTTETDLHGWTIPETEDSGQAYANAFDSFFAALDDEVIEKGLAEDRPTAGTSGRWYFATDDMTIHLDTGSGWAIVASADPTNLDGSGGNAGQFLKTDGTADGIEWASSGSGSGVDADTVDGYHGDDFGALSEEEDITETWSFNLGAALAGSRLHFRGRADDTWAAQYTNTPDVSIQKATSEAILLGAWSSQSGDTGYVFHDQNGNYGAEIIPDTGEVYAPGQVYSNGEAVPAKTTSQTITGLWTFSDDVRIDGDLVDEGSSNVIYDASAGEVLQARLGGPAASLSTYPIPNGDLANDSVTVAGTPIDLGASGNIDAADLVSGAATDGQVPTADGAGNVAWEDQTGSGETSYTDSDAIDAINTDGDHGSTAQHDYYTDENAQDAVGNNVGDGLSYDDPSGAVAFDVVATGNTTLSSGAATVDTGVSSGTTATFQVALGPTTDDAEIAASIVAASGGNYTVHLDELNTSVGNPTVEYDVIRVR